MIVKNTSAFQFHQSDSRIIQVSFTTSLPLHSPCDAIRHPMLCLRMKISFLLSHSKFLVKFRIFILSLVSVASMIRYNVLIPLRFMTVQELTKRQHPMISKRHSKLQFVFVGLQKIVQLTGREQVGSTLLLKTHTWDIPLTNLKDKNG